MVNTRQFPLNEVVQAQLAGPQRKLGAVQNIGNFLLTQRLEKIKKGEEKIEKDKQELRQIQSAEEAKSAGMQEKREMTSPTTGVKRTFEQPGFRVGTERVVDLLPQSEEEVKKFAEYLPGYDWQMGKPQKVQASAYDRFVVASARKKSDDRKNEINIMKMNLYGQKESTLTPKDVVTYWAKLNEAVTDIMLSDEEKKVYQEEIKNFEPLYKRIVEKQKKREGVTEESIGQMSLDDIFQ